jgi:bacillithiol biosynthesis deacetylase BshB1
MKLDVLAFGAHPDDVELSCSGSLLKLKASGKKIGIIDLTKGEMGTRGTDETRREEAAASSHILGLDVRENLDLGDGSFEVNKDNREAVIRAIRKYRPSIVLANAVNDRHTDHPRGAQLVKEACFLSGLSKIKTVDEGVEQEAYRPEHLFHYIQYYHITPDIVVDVSPYHQKKMESIMAYKTQFFDPNSDEPVTMISSERFLKFVEARAMEMGAAIEVKYGEGFTSATPVPYDFINLL